MRYKVEILTADGREHHKHGLSLAQAWRAVEHHARRGLQLHGGAIARSNWGARGGQFPVEYRAAVIRMDNQKRAQQ